jgi:hypothetical protein
MIKLKNLWKIALATMAMSAMLVACDTSSDSGNKSEEDSLGGVGVYSYTVNIADISGAWGGNSVSPAFSVVLLNETTLAACSTAGDFKQATAAEPEYQIGAFGNMKIADTSKTGDFKVYGANPVNDEYQYYTGVTASIDDTSFVLTVDMTKLVKTELKGLWADTGNGDEAVMTADDLVDLAGYKPYVIALGTEAVDPTNRVFGAWSADVMKMEEGATAPANPTAGAPVMPKLSEMAFVCSNFGNVAITFSGDVATAEITYALANNTWSESELTGIAFGICNNEAWGEKYTGAAMTAFDTPVAVKYNDSNNNTVAADILEEGKTYVLTINAKDKTVKVSAK